MNKLLQLKPFINEKLPEVEITISTATLRSDNGKATLTVRQLTIHLKSLKSEILSNRNITSKHLSRGGLRLNQSGIIIQMISDTKTEDTFPTAQFCMQGYSAPFRRDKTSQVRGIML